jgi:hypothetical protein
MMLQIYHRESPDVDIFLIGSAAATIPRSSDAGSGISNLAG